MAAPALPALLETRSAGDIHYTQRSAMIYTIVHQNISSEEVIAPGSPETQSRGEAD